MNELNQKKHSIFKKVVAASLVVFHIFTVGNTPQALASISSNDAVILDSAVLSQGGGETAYVGDGSTITLNGVIGQTFSAESSNTIINKKIQTGFIYTSQLVVLYPKLIQNFSDPISWDVNNSYDGAFDLDDYFSSPQGLELTYTVSGNDKIIANIHPESHVVSFYAASDNWYGTEQIVFTATDTNGNSVSSNPITLQVVGEGNAPTLAYIPDITVQETELVEIVPQVYDADGDSYTVSFQQPLDSQGSWQTGYESMGQYNVEVKVTDATGLFASQIVHIAVTNKNRLPVIEQLTDIDSVSEGQSVDISSYFRVSDDDNEELFISYSQPFDEQGYWLTDYESAGTYPCTLTVSDAYDSVEHNFSITVDDVNRLPEVSLSADSYTIVEGEDITFTITANDDDNDLLEFVLAKDGTEISSGDITTEKTVTVSFDEQGDYQITATVIDEHGAIATDDLFVDIVDINSDRDPINPIMGDFNGDSLTDLGLHNSDTGTWEICYSNGGVFTSAQQILTNFGKTTDNWPIGGDFNGDGKSDVGVYNNKTCVLQIALATASQFSVSGIWLDLVYDSVEWLPFTGNFDGDKYTDFAVYNKNTGQVQVARSTGSTFETISMWNDNVGTDYSALGGDFNGDSLTDLGLFDRDTGEFKVLFSNGSAFVESTVFHNSFGKDQSIIVSDFNNDGLSDIGYWDKDTLQWHYAISTGSSFVDKGVWLDSFGSNLFDSASVGDFNGDGVTDAALFEREQFGIDRWSVNISTKQKCDLLTEIDNGIGGKTSITYKYAASDNNPELPFPVYVTESVTSVDMLPIEDPQESYSQTFNYSGGYFDFVEREFRGFEKVVVTDPVTSNYTETYFYQGRPSQDGALKGKIEKIVSYDGNNKKISETNNVYEVVSAGPESNCLGFATLTETTSTVWEENETYVTTKNSFTYDDIGNITETINYGDVEQTGDERKSFSTYNQAYLQGFNRPSEVILRNADDELVSHKKFTEYDSRGNLLKEEIYNYNPDTAVEEWIPSNYEYDSYGNVVKSTNAKGISVDTVYESTFHAYPQSVTNSLGHTITYVYDYRFGQAVSVTDSNGATSTTTVDSLGRITEEINAFNETVTIYSYPDFNTKVTTQSGAGQNDLVTISYTDGLGRNYKTVTSGEDGDNAKQIISEVVYNNRGLVDKEYVPRYIDEPRGAYVTYTYDLRGRVTQTKAEFEGTAYDTVSSVDYITPLYSETTNPRGKIKGKRVDVYGNVVEIIEKTSAGVFHTYYEYDDSNNLVKVTDNQGNVSEMFYDYLGRKIRMNDPDMGTWHYEYDVLGNLVKQTDAKNQVLEFEYDDINRLTEKKYLVSGDWCRVTYLYDDDSKSYCEGRLSKVIDQSGQTEFFYDLLGREVKSVKTIDDDSYTVQRSYDKFDRLKTLTYPDGEVVEYSYDYNSGLLEKVSSVDNGPSTVDYVEDITYNSQGQINVIQYGNGTETNYTYASDSRLQRILTLSRDTQGAIRDTLQNLYYQFDKNGNLTQLTDNLTSNIRTYQYDDLDRLTNANNIPNNTGYQNFNYSYDSIGNMTNKSDVGIMQYGFNAGPHALTSAAGYNYTYDANGNMLTGRGKTYNYDVENRLIEVDSGGIITTYSYDGDGGRVKQVVGAALESARETTYIGSLFEIETVGTQSTVRKHIFAGSNKVCTTKSVDNGPWTVGYIHSDHLGSSSVITDENGDVAMRYEYSPYGEVSKQDTIHSSLDTSYLFTGKELDDNGLYYYSARYYDPVIGRFISADTIVQSPGDPQTLNRYAYCRNNPLKYTDPSGHFFSILVAIASAVWSAMTAVATFAAAHPFLAGAMINLACNTANIHNVQDFAVYAGVGALSGGAGAGLGGVAGGAYGAFWGSAAGALAYGTVSATGNSRYGGASWGQSLKAGVTTGAIMAGTAMVAYGVGKGLQKVGKWCEAKAALKPVGQKGQGAPTKALGKNVAKQATESQALSQRNKSVEVEIIDVGEETVQEGTKLYRAYGGKAKWDGKSWTDVDPNTVPDFRAQAGLPNENTGRFVAEGKLIDTKGVVVREAIDIYSDGTNNMVKEYIVPDVSKQININRVSGVNPEF